MNKDSNWTMQDAARQNAIDTCLEEGLTPGTDEYSALFEQSYRETLAMLRDAYSDEYIDEDRS